MKIIDVLNKKANGELKIGFSFAYDGYVWEVSIYGAITNKNNETLGHHYNIDRILNDKIIVIDNSARVDEED